MDSEETDPSVLKFLERVVGPFDLSFRCRVCGERMSVSSKRELMPWIDKHHEKSPKCLYLMIF
jgi:hypothetical protein